MIWSVPIALAALLVPVLLNIVGTTSIFTALQTPYLSNKALPTYSGYFVADANSNARMYYAYYEAVHPDKPLEETPLILWLQGGPGCSGSIGNFYEMGRWRIDAELHVNENEGAWNRKFGILFVDNPVGTGFSIAEKDEDIPTDQPAVATHLLSVLTHFFNEHPSFRSRPFFLAGESYAGKYVPALGYHIVSHIEKLEGKPFERQPMRGRGSGQGLSRPFRLEGLVIGNGLTDPKIQVLGHAEAAYQFGVIDFDQKMEVAARAEKVAALVDSEDWEAAHTARTDLVNWIQNVSGLATLLDVRRHAAYHYNREGKEYLALFLNQPQVKSALKADPNTTWVSCNPRVRQAMKNDTMKSAKWMVDSLLPKLPLLLYQGLYDIKDGAASSEDWMRTLAWRQRDNFFASPRRLWHVRGQLAGYWRSFGSLTHVVLRGAGHEVPADEAVNAQNMIETWVEAQLASLSTTEGLPTGD